MVQQRQKVIIFYLYENQLVEIFQDIYLCVASLAFSFVQEILRSLALVLQQSYSAAV